MSAGAEEISAEANSSGNIVEDNTKTRSSSSSQSSKASRSNKSAQARSFSMPVIIGLGVAAAVAVAGGIWGVWKSRCNSGKAPALDDFNAQLDAELKAIDAIGMDDESVPDEEAELAMRQADIAKRERALAAALAEGDAEMARIDALDDEGELEDLDADELAELETELAELEGGDMQAVASTTAAAVAAAF